MIAIVSDIHDNLPNLDKFLDYIKHNNIKKIICLGDVTNNITLKKLVDGFDGDISLVGGNADFFDINCLKNRSKVNYNQQQGVLNVLGKKITFVHLPHQAKYLADSGEYDYVFYGHTHKPSEKKIGQTTLLNPGTLSGMFGKSTFAVWDEMRDLFHLILVDEL